MHEDLGSDPQHPLKKLGMVVNACYPSTEGQEDPWGLLACQSGQVGEFQVQ